MPGTAPDRPQARPSPFAGEVLRRIPRTWLPMTAALVTIALLLHQRDRRSDRALAWERGAVVARLHLERAEEAFSSLAALTLQLAREESAASELAAGDAEGDVARALERADTERRYGELLRLQSVLDHVLVRERSGAPRSGALRDAEGRPVAWSSGRTLTPPAATGARPFPEERRAGPAEVAPPPAFEGLRKVVETARATLGPIQPHAPSAARGRTAEHGSLVVAAAAVRGGTRPPGVLVIGRSCADLLEPQARSSAAGSGWCAMVDEQGHFLEDPLEPARSWSASRGAPPRFAQSFPRAWELVRSKPRGQLLLPDGLFTFAHIAGDGHWSWESPPGPAIVSFVPVDAIYSSSDRTRQRLLQVGSLLGLALLVLSWRLAWLSASRDRDGRALAASEQALRQLSARLFEVQEEERKHISRDLHDELGQLATAMTIDLKRAQQTDDAAKREALLARARETAERSLRSVHQIAARLRGSEIDDLGLAHALIGLCEDFRETHELPVELDLALSDAPVESAAASALYRAVQEALTNVVRHAQATRVEVRIVERGAELEASVRDDGLGFRVDEGSRGRLGLLGMRERIALVGGRFSIESEPGSGTLVRVRVPRDGRRLPEELP